MKIRMLSNLYKVFYGNYNSQPFMKPSLNYDFSFLFPLYFLVQYKLLSVRMDLAGESQAGSYVTLCRSSLPAQPPFSIAMLLQRGLTAPICTVLLPLMKICSVTCGQFLGF